MLLVTFYKINENTQTPPPPPKKKKKTKTKKNLSFKLIYLKFCFLH